MATMLNAVMPVQTESAPAKLSRPFPVPSPGGAEAAAQLPSGSEAEDLELETPPPKAALEQTPALQRSSAPALRHGPHGWPIPSSLSTNPEQARSGIQLPAFNDFLL